MNVGPTVVAAMTADRRVGAHPTDDVQGTRPVAAAQTSARLELGWKVWHTIKQAEGPDAALAWLVGANPRLDNQTPVTAIRELRAAKVMGAARANLNDAPAT